MAQYIHQWVKLLICHKPYAQRLQKIQYLRILQNPYRLDNFFELLIVIDFSFAQLLLFFQYFFFSHLLSHYLFRKCLLTRKSCMNSCLFSFWENTKEIGYCSFGEIDVVLCKVSEWSIFEEILKEFWLKSNCMRHIFGERIMLSKNMTHRLVFFNYAILCPLAPKSKTTKNTTNERKLWKWKYIFTLFVEARN